MIKEGVTHIVSLFTHKIHKGKAMQEHLKETRRLAREGQYAEALKRFIWFHNYALGWYANHQRILYWDRFGHPDNYFTRIA